MLLKIVKIQELTKASPLGAPVRFGFKESAVWSKLQELKGIPCY